MSYNNCCVPGCNKLRKDVRLHTFPTCEVTRKKWLDVIDSADLQVLASQNHLKHYVCHDHFEARFVTSKRRLRKAAYPSLFSPGELSSGKPDKDYENNENLAPNQQFDHTYSKQKISLPLNNKTTITKGTVHDHTYSHPVTQTISKKQTHVKDVNSIPGPSSVELTISDESLQNKELAAEYMVSVTESEDKPQHKDAITASKGGELKPKSPRKRLTPRLIVPKISKRKRLLKSSSNLTPTCRRLYKEYKKSQRQLSYMQRAKRALQFSKEESFEKLTRNMNAYSKKLFWMQIRLCTKQKKGRRFNLEEKIIALSILKQSPKCYKFLQKIFILPSKNTLNKLICQLKIEPGINPQIFEQMKKEVASWAEDKKLCTVIFDEMAIEAGLHYDPHSDKINGYVELNNRKNQLADHALVFIVKGAVHKWHQPVAFYFCEGATSGVELKAILKQIVKAIGETGLIPIALISDQGTAFQSALKSLQEETRREQILANENTDGVIHLDKFELSVVYDPPHLIKGLRNNFLTKDILFEDEVATWQDIVDVYKSDCKHAETRLLHKLNDEHVIPEKIKKMKVKNAARVLSKTVASALGYTSEFSQYADGTQVSKTMKTTAKLVSFLDDLFDSVNGASIHHAYTKGKTLRKAVTGTSKHHKYWDEAIKKLKSIKFIDPVSKKRSIVPSLKNFITTLESFKRLWQLLKNKGVKIMRPRYFNSDTVENFFGQIRAYNYRNNNPDCRSFLSTYKSLLITGFIKFHNDSFNCEDDDFHQLIKINTLFADSFSKSDEISCQQYNITTEENNIVKNAVEEARKERLTIHSRAYTAGWVVRKILMKLKCKQCKRDLTAKESNTVHGWINHKEYKTLNKSKLTYPSERAVRCFGVIIKESNNYLESNGHSHNLTKEIKNILIKDNNIMSLIKCASHQHLTTQMFIMFTLKLSVFNWCNIINRILRGTDIIRLEKRSLPLMQQKAFLKYKKRLKNKKLNK